MREPPAPSAAPLPFEEAARGLWDDLRASVERHRRSDVPLGVFLSGGIDSSSIAAAVCDIQPASAVRTYSIGFDDPSFDESAQARAVAEHLGTDHHARTFSAEDNEFMLAITASADTDMNRRGEVGFDHGLPDVRVCPSVLIMTTLEVGEVLRAD